MATYLYNNTASFHNISNMMLRMFCFGFAVCKCCIKSPLHLRNFLKKQVLDIGSLITHHLVRNSVAFVQLKKRKKHPQSLRPATLLKVKLLHRCFSSFLNCTNGTKLGKASLCKIKLKMRRASRLRTISVITNRNTLLTSKGCYF